jgi:UDP-glucose 4-epimerase
LITGGAGLIGSTVADQLVELGTPEIVVFDNLSRGRIQNLETSLRSGRVTLIEGDVRDPGAVAKALDGIDVVFHQAAIRITQCAELPRMAFDVLAGGTMNVVEAAVAAGVSKVVAASSASVYGLATTFPTDEDHHPWANRTLYGACKVFNEGVLRSYYDMAGLDYVALRYFNVYGPRMDVHGVYTEVLVRWMERLAAGEPPIIMGDGHQTMDFVYSEDIARANILAATADVTDTVFNVASGTETSLNDLARTLATAMGSNLDPIYEPERKVNAVPRRLADTSRARDLLDFEAKIALDEGLTRLVRWWRAESHDWA